jgi:hypothetical protein
MMSANTTKPVSRPKRCQPPSQQGPHRSDQQVLASKADPLRDERPDIDQKEGTEWIAAEKDRPGRATEISGDSQVTAYRHELRPGDHVREKSQEHQEMHAEQSEEKPPVQFVVAEQTTDTEQAEHQCPSRQADQRCLEFLSVA